MNLFMQGMRRSGTTIVFDILSQDKRFDMYYEPFSMGQKGALGGGSGIQQFDLMEKIRTLRKSFIESRGLSFSDGDFNCGAPTNPLLELETELPAHCYQYLEYMIEQNEHTVAKFTRMYRKVSSLKELDPHGKFILLVRHPQEVVSSYMYGRDQRRLEKFPDREKFFNTCDAMNPWKSLDFFKGIIEQENLQHLSDMPNWKRYLMLWKYTFDKSYKDAEKAFGANFMVCQHEKIIENPRQAVLDIYKHIEISPDESVIEWAEKNVRKTKKECYKYDPRGKRLIKRWSLVRVLI